VEELKFIIHLRGKQAVDAIYGFKGSLQSAIKTTGKYPDASLSMNKKERTIEVENVDGSYLEKALPKIRFSKESFKRVDFDIEEVLEAPKDVQLEGSAEKKYTHWVETTQKRFQKEKRRFRHQIEKLEEENKKLSKEKETLAELRQEDRKNYAELQKSHEAVSKMVDALAEGKVRDPADACTDWVGDWMVTAQKIESQIAGSVGDVEPHEIDSLLSKTEKTVLKAASRRLKVDLVDVKDLSSMAGGLKWEDTDDYRRNIDGYTKAMDEVKFLENVNAGKVDVPDTVVDILMKEINEDENNDIIIKFDTAKEDFRIRTEKAETASSFLEEIERVEKVKELVRQFKKLKSLPVAIKCDQDGKKWTCEVLYPYGEVDGFLERIVDDIVFNTLRKQCSKVPARKRGESVCVMWAPVPGKYGSWKDVSRFQEKVQGDITERLKKSVLSGLKVPWTVSKVMNQRNP
jgi:hypothetical protein